MDQKRGQITLFIIVGILLVAISLFMFYPQKQDIVKQPTNFDTKPVKIFIDNCIKQSLENGIDDVGFHDSLLLENYLNNNIKTCTNNFVQFPGASILEEDIHSSVILTEDNLTLVINIDYPITITTESSETRFSAFYLNYALSSHLVLDTNMSITLFPYIVQSENLAAILDIPPGTNITLKNGTPVDEVSIEIMDNYQFSGDTIGFLSYDLKPDGATFNPPITLQIKYDEYLLPKGVEEQYLKISYFDLSLFDWVSWPSTVDIENNIVTANISHFTPMSITYVNNTIGSITGFDNSIIAYYPFDINSHNVMRSTPDGLVNGATLSNGKFNNAYYFEGNSNIILPNIKPTPPYTIQSWIYLSTLNNMDIYGDELHVRGSGLQLLGGNFYSIASNGTAEQRWDTGFSPSKYRWHHVTQVFDTTKTRTYVDGNLINEEEETLSDGVIDFQIGKSSYGYFMSNSFNGKVDEVAFWSRSLSDCEIAKLANGPSACSDIIVFIPESCDVDNYLLAIRDKDNNTIIHFSEFSINNNYQVETSGFNCDKGYELIGGYFKGADFYQTLRRTMDCNQNIIHSETAKDETC